MQPGFRDSYQGMEQTQSTAAQPVDRADDPLTGGPLALYNLQFSLKGQLLRYASTRSAQLHTRLIVAFGTMLLLGLIYGPFWSATMFSLYAVIDICESFYLRSLPRRLEEGGSITAARRLSTLFSAADALSICSFALVPFLEQHPSLMDQAVVAEPFFAICVILGASLSASLDYRYHPASAAVRLLIFALLPLGMIAHVYLTREIPGEDVQLLAAGLLGFYIAQIWFLVFVQKRHENSRRSIRSQALQRQALEDAYMRLFNQKQEARRLAMIAEHANDGVMLIGCDGIVRWINDGFMRLTGYAFDEIVGRNPGTLLNSPDTDPEALRLIEQGRAEGKPFRTELVNRRKDGRDIWIETNQVPVFDDAGRIEVYIAVERDVTAAKEYEKKLEEARRAAEEGARIKEEFLATMSHEIRTPMNGVIGMAQMLQATELNEDQRLYTDTILSSSRALLALINDVLDLSRMNAAGVSLFSVDFDLHACIRDIALLLRGQATDKGLDLLVDIGPEVPAWVSGDDRRLRQILVNLVGNAIKFTPFGQVTLRVRASEEEGRLALVITVEDTGIGIADNKLEQIFERFSQADTAISRRYGGTGLGLSISRGLAQAMGGDITVHSTLGEGSVFTVKLSLAVAADPILVPQTDEDFGAAVDFSALEGLRLLVAEDNRVNRLLISKFLAAVPVQLRFARNGAEAVDLAATYRPQVILMDMSMPEVNGLEATRQIRQMAIAQPFIAALTANVDDSSRRACVEAGMDAFLCKPLARQELLSLLLGFSENARVTEQG